jgi:ribose transport system substrate-binding protein
MPGTDGSKGLPPNRRMPGNKVSPAGDRPNLSLTVVKACEVLRSFGGSEDLRTLRDVVVRTGLNKSTTLRLLHSLRAGGLIERTPDGKYRLAMRPIERRRCRIGYAGQSAQSAFCREVTASLRIAAELEEFELIVFDNCGDQKVTMQNVDKLIDAKVDLAIEYQPYDTLAPLIAERFREAGIPLVAVSFPHPGATYYGPNNYVAGVMAGNALGSWAKRQTKQVHEVVLLGRPLSGPLTQSRIKGIEAGLLERFPSAGDSRIVHLDGNGEFSRSFEVVKKYFRSSTSDNTLLGAINDESALGALLALHELGKSDKCVLVSQGASAEGRGELRKAGTRLIGSVAYFPEKYGHDLLKLTFMILQHRSVPQSVFVNHVLMTPKNVDLYYPQDNIDRQRFT